MSSEQAADDSLPSRHPSTSGPRVIGLRQLLLVCLAAGVWISCWMMKPQVEPLRESVNAMRLQAGRLVIDDPSQVSVIALPILEDRRFQYRVFIPPSPPLTLLLQTRGIDDRSFLETPAVRREIASGEHLIELAAVEMPDKSHSIRLSVDGETMRTIDEPADWQASRSASWSSRGQGSQTEHSPVENVQLLRYRFMKPSKDGSSSSSNASSNGLVLWLAPKSTEPD